MSYFAGFYDDIMRTTCIKWKVLQRNGQT